MRALATIGWAGGRFQLPVQAQIAAPPRKAPMPGRRRYSCDTASDTRTARPGGGLRERSLRSGGQGGRFLLTVQAQIAAPPMKAPLPGRRRHSCETASDTRTARPEGAKQDRSQRTAGQGVIGQPPADLKVCCSDKRSRAKPQRSALCRWDRHKNCRNEAGVGATGAELEKPTVTGAFHWTKPPVVQSSVGGSTYSGPSPRGR